MENSYINTKLIGIMVGVSFLAVIITTSFLYIETVGKSGDHLKDMALHLSRLINSVVDFQKAHIISQHKDFKGKLSDLVRRESINQIKQARGNLELQGDIEITVGYLKNDAINWINQSYQELEEYESLPMGHEHGIPMQLALNKKTGIVKAKDYNGRLVLAAHTYIPSIDIGIVTKTYLSKIRFRFIQGASLAMIPAFVIVFFGVLIFKKLFNPIISKLQDDKEEYKKLLAKMVLAQQEVEDSEHRLQCFFDAAFEGIAITEDGVFIDSNKRFADMFGYTVKEIVGMKISELVYAKDLFLVSDNIESEYERTYEHRSVHRDGSLLTVEVHGQKTKLHGRYVRITAIHDITAQRTAETELAKLNKYQKQVSKMEAIGSFAAGIAHDFNNALQPIVGNCDLIMLDMNMKDKNCKVHHKNIMAIISAAEVASLLVRRIQSFARQEGETEILVPLSLPDCIKESFNFLRSIVPQSIEMELNMGEEIELVMANDVTIKQILMNICKNASQAMLHEEGRITIDVCNEEIITEQFGITKGEYVRISVEDNGSGMCTEHLERAFDPYFTTKSEGEGTGIGLSVVDRIVRNYGGFTRLYSEIDKGTRIVIYIPAYLEAEESLKRDIKNKKIHMGNGESILLVDDEELIIEAVTAILESLNYKVTSFVNSMEALREFQLNPIKYDVVLTDLTMPKMTGLVLIKEIKNINPDIKIILCSGLSSKGKYAESYKELVDVYVRKPVTRKEYADALKTVV